MNYGSTVLFVKDVSKVLTFYERAFGFELKFYDKDFDFGMLDAGGVELGIASDKAGERMMPGGYQASKSGHPEGVEIAFYTEEVSAAYQRAVDAGAASLAAPKKMEWGQAVAYVRSIEGTIIGFCTPVMKEDAAGD